MKWLFLLLLTINIAIFAWGYQLEQMPEPAIEAGGDVGNMRLISELIEEEEALKAEQLKQEDATKPELNREKTTETASSEKQSKKTDQNKSAEQDKKPSPEKILSKCGTVGPLKDHDLAKRVAEELREAEIKARLERKIKKEQIGYWVVVPPEENGGQVQAKIEELTQAGLKDIWHFRGGGMKDSISLGMFNEKENANSFRNKVLAMGFVTEMRPRYLNKTSYLVEFEISKPKTVAENMWRDVKQKYSKLPFTKQSCE